MTSGTEAKSEERVFRWEGVSVHLRVTAEDSGGAYCAIEMELPPRFPGAPAHYHKDMQERLVVLHGEIAMEVDGRWNRLAAGDSQEAAAGVRHGFRNESDQPAGVLILARPAGHEQFFRELFAWMQREPQWPPAELERLVEFGLRHDTFYG